jgi:hypothetical protein
MYYKERPAFKIYPQYRYNLSLSFDFGSSHVLYYSPLVSIHVVSCILIGHTLEVRSPFRENSLEIKRNKNKNKRDAQ